MNGGSGAVSGIGFAVKGDGGDAFIICALRWPRPTICGGVKRHADWRIAVVTLAPRSLCIRPFPSVAATRAGTGSWGSGRACTGTRGECKGGQGSEGAIGLITLKV